MSDIGEYDHVNNVKRHSTEEQLKSKMLAALKGDSRGYDALLRDVTSLLRAFYARRMRKAAHDVEDLVQETLMALHTRRESYDHRRAFTPWLFSIARHKLIDHYRLTRHDQTIDGLDDILVAEGFERSVHAAMDVDRLLTALPRKQARAIRDTKILGLSVAEAARHAGLTVSDVKVSIHRGMRTLTDGIALGR
jgi:RNA polymerase sigma-70 factor (ECF subfamily)